MARPRSLFPLGLLLLTLSATTPVMAAASLSLAASPNPAYWNQTVTLTASLDTAGGAAPAGAATFHVSGQPIAGSAWALQSGTVYTSTATFVAGPTYWTNPPVTTSLTATTSDPNYSSLTGSTSFTVNQRTAVIAISGTASPVTYSPTGTITLTASVGDNLGTAITNGSVDFYYVLASSAPNATPPPTSSYLGTGTYAGVAGNAGTWTLSVPDFNPNSAGSSYFLYAFYYGSSSYIPPNYSSSYFPIVVNPQPTTVTLSGVPATTPVNQPFTVTAQASTTPTTFFPGSAYFDFFDNGVQLNASHIPVSPANSATYQITLTTAAVHSITVQFTPPSPWAVSNSAASTVNVTGPSAVPTTTTLVSGANPSGQGQVVTFTATVTSGSGTPTGSVNFFVGSSQFGNSVPLVNGVAQTTISFSTVGAVPHIKAVYVPTGNFAASTSNIVDQVVNAPAPATATVHTSTAPNPALANQPITFTVTVTGSSGTPTGNIQLFDEETSTLLGGGPLVSGTATFPIQLPAGNYDLGAVYSGDGTYRSVTGDYSLAVIAAPAVPTLTEGWLMALAAMIAALAVLKLRR